MKSSVYLFFILFLSLNSCNLGSDCNKVKLSDELAIWADCYEEGDTIVLRSDLGNYDSLKVTSKKRDYSPCNKFELGPNQHEYVDIFINSICVNVDDCKKNMVKKKNIVLRLNSDEIYDNEFLGVDVYNLGSLGETWKPDSIPKVVLEVPYFGDSIQAFKFDKSNARSSYPYINSEYPCAVKLFHWSREYGLVQYVTEDDEVYRLINK